MLDLIKKIRANQQSSMNQVKGFFSRQISEIQAEFMRMVDQKEHQISSLKKLVVNKFSDLIGLISLKSEANY